jgi:hypothetical protein
MPKIPVVDAHLTAEQLKARRCERDLGYVLRALLAHDVESAARAYADAVERGGDEFLECCQRLPAKVRAELADVAKLVAKGEKPRS